MLYTGKVIVGDEGDRTTDAEFKLEISAEFKLKISAEFTHQGIFQICEACIVEDSSPQLVGESEEKKQRDKSTHKVEKARKPVNCTILKVKSVTFSLSEHEVDVLKEEEVTDTM